MHDWLPWFVGAITLGIAGVCFEVFVHPVAGIIGATGVLIGTVVGFFIGERIEGGT